MSSNQQPVTFRSENPVKELAEAMHILLNLRDSTISWQHTLGSRTNNRKKYWEQVADTFLAKHTKIKPDE